jgi:predicted DNA-binding transcriptional regulator AlpA
MNIIPKSKIAGHGAKYDRKKEEAVVALASTRTVEEAARTVGLSPQTLYRWLKDPEFAAACDEAGEAILGQALGRLQQASGTAVTILLQVMHDPSAPRSARLRAADIVLRHRKSAREIEKSWARLAEMKRAREASKPERRTRRDNASLADNRGSPQPAGQGAKCRRMKAAIAALLTQRNVEDAAHVLGIGTTTLYRWMKHREFISAYREARLAAFGRASVRLRQASGSAITTIWNIMIDPGSPAWMKVKAGDLALQHAAAASEDDIAAWLLEYKREGQAIPSFLGADRRTFDEIEREPPKVAA